MSRGVEFWRNNAKSDGDGEKRESERANQIGNTYAIGVTTTTREDFNMHRLTDVPQHADFKCKYKSAMQTAELV